MVDGIATVALLVAGGLRWLLTSEYAMEQSRIDARRERRLGGPGQPAMFDQAIESGVVPSGADGMAWIRELRGENVAPSPTSLQRLLDVVIVACVILQLTEFLRSATPRDILIGIAIGAAGIVIFGVLVLIQRFRRRAEDEGEARLLDLLERQAVAYNVVSDLGSRRRRWLPRRLSGRGTGRP